MTTAAKTLYETDFLEWTAKTAEVLRERRFDQLDIENVIEEIETLGRSEVRALESQLQRLLLPVIKMRVQPERAGRSWRASILSAQDELRRSLKVSPSLRRHVRESLPEIYQTAIKIAGAQTGLGARAKAAMPQTCPYTLDELLALDPTAGDTES